MLQNSSKLSSGDPRLEEAKSAMNQLQAEFNNYKKEKCENERYLFYVYFLTFYPPHRELLVSSFEVMLII